MELLGGKAKLLVVELALVSHWLALVAHWLALVEVVVGWQVLLLLLLLLLLLVVLVLHVQHAVVVLLLVHQLVFVHSLEVLVLTHLSSCGVHQRVVHEEHLLRTHCVWVWLHSIESHLSNKTWIVKARHVDHVSEIVVVFHVHVWVLPHVDVVHRRVVSHHLLHLRLGWNPLSFVSHVVVHIAHGRVMPIVVHWHIVHVVRIHHWRLTYHSMG
jgi:hypothetical protein